MEANKKRVTKLFLRDRKLIKSLAFISQSCFKVPVTVRLKIKSIMKILSIK